MQQSGEFQNRIDEESEEINTLLLSAKHGNWDSVWPIIGTPDNPKKAYLINCIPENRRWGVLHQGVYWKDPSVVQKLLKFQACDSGLRTKECASEVGVTSGMTAIELSNVYGCNEIGKVLSKPDDNFKTETTNIDTFRPWDEDMELKGHGLIHITLAAYKKTFHPEDIDPKKSIVSVLEDIFKDINPIMSILSVFRNIFFFRNTLHTRWKEVRDKICDSLYVVSKESVSKLKQCTSKESFFETLINIYTEESTLLYTHVNTALRRQETSDYKPSASDLAMGPYVVMYQTLLLSWEDLKRENATTYRRMLLRRNDVDKYQIGVKFKWLSFVSSSVLLENAIAFPTCTGVKGEYSVIFTIDNTTDSKYQPRDIERYATYMERERVYPAGASFMVTDIVWQNLEARVSLKLLS